VLSLKLFAAACFETNQF